MNPFSATRRLRGLAFSLSLAICCVWLVGSCAALSSAIHAAKHACCEHEKLADSCTTLCASADWDSTPSAEQASVVPSLRPVFAQGVPLAFSASLNGVPALTASHSPPLYLQHAALLI